MPGIWAATVNWFRLEAELAVSDPVAAVAEFWATFRPGGKLRLTTFVEQKYYLVIEVALVIAISYLLFQRRAPAKQATEALTEQEVDELVGEWEPAPLAPPADEEPAVHTPVLSSHAGPRMVVDGRENVLAFCAHDFWGASADAAVLEAGRNAVSYYGVGSCGPRGFYGTIDVHLKLERELADFMAREEGIIYSYSLATMSSVIPAFATKKDVVVMDEAASWPLRNGATLSRAKVIFFKHNDVADLERILLEVVAEGRRKPLNRRYIVVEGVYQHLGDVAPLRAIFELKHRYKFRVAVDESLSFGVLGATGRGACEAAGISPEDVDVLTGSMSTGLASAGGFCVGSSMMVDHQRLSGAGYCFSASLPPALAVSASAALRRFRCQRERILSSLRTNARLLQLGVRSVAALRVLADAAGSRECPLVVAAPRRGLGSVQADIARVVSLRDALLRDFGILVAVQRPTKLETTVVPACKLVVTSAHTEADVKECVRALRTVTSAW